MSFSIATTVAVPYPGLRPFLREESQVFFGRDQQIDEVLARLKRNQFLGMVGTSGCGKSSLIRAGILPALESGLMGEIGSTWYVADMKPGDAPLSNLASGLINCGVLGERWCDTPEGIALLTAALRRSDVSLVDLIRQVQLPPFTNLLVLADQFEEVFRLQQKDPNEALAFVNLLLTTGRDRSVPVYVVLTMRTDFLGSCSLFPGLPEALNDSQYLCPRLSRDQLTEAIEGPASVFGGNVERSLTTQILNDAGANSDQLPLVQHVLSRMWHCVIGDRYGTGSSRTERVLRLDDYRAVGGLNGSTPPGGFRISHSSLASRQAGDGFTHNALSQHADEAYFSLSDGGNTNVDRDADHKPSRKQMIAQMLFRCLAERVPSGQYVRRPVKVKDVAAVADCSVAEMIEVVEVFRREDRSFLTPAKPKQDGLNKGASDLKPETTIDISHEALIRHWELLSTWVACEATIASEMQRLAQDARSWRDGKRGLLRQPELGVARKLHAQIPSPKWVERYISSDEFTLTLNYLEESTLDENRELRMREEQIVRNHELEFERQRAADAVAAATRQRRVTLGAIATAMIAIILALMSFNLYQEATSAQRRALDAHDEARAARADAELLSNTNTKLRQELGIKQGLLYHIGIGISAYPGPSALRSAHLDPANLNSALSRNAPVERPVESILLIDAKATRSAVIDSLKQVATKISDSDVVFISYSGFQTTTKDNGSRLIPVDGDLNDIDKTCLSQDDLFTVFKGNRARIIFYFDTVAAETFANILAVEYPTVTVFASCGKDEFSSEDAEGGEFSKVGAAGLNGLADANGDGAVTLEELAGYVQSKSTEASRSQHPVIRGLLTQLILTTPKRKRAAIDAVVENN